MLRHDGLAARGAAGPQGRDEARLARPGRVGEAGEEGDERTFALSCHDLVALELLSTI